LKEEFILVLCALLVCGGAAGATDSCQLPDGLFERRSALVAQVGAYNAGTDQSKQLRDINEKYFQLMSRLDRDAKPGAALEGRECCEARISDPIANLLCKFSGYLRSGRKQVNLLLESVPADPRERDALWALDEIAHLHDSDTHAVLFGPYGPVTSYLDELFRLVRSGNEEALSKYLELYPYSDGIYGEQMVDQTEKLLTVNADLLLKEWKIFKQHPNALPRLQESLTEDEKNAIKSKLAKKQECLSGSSACSEIIKTFLR
jgi:hypothetical protein